MLLSFKSLLDELANNKRIFIGTTHSATCSFFISEYQKVIKNKILVITSTQRRGYELYEEISFFHGGNVRLFPHWGTLPYRAVTLSQDILLERISILAELASNIYPDVLIAPVRSIIQKILPLEKLKEFIIRLTTGMTVEREAILSPLKKSGYAITSITEHPGEYSIHGGIIDVFSPSEKFPVRIELDGDVISSMRIYDPGTQRKIKETDNYVIFPPSENIFLSDSLHEALDKIKIRGDELGIPKQKRKLIEEKFIKCELFPGKDFYLAYFCDLVPFFKYLPREYKIIIEDDFECSQELDDFIREVHKVYSEIKEEPYPPPEMIFISPKEFKNFAFENASVTFTKQHDAGVFLIHSETCEDLRGYISHTKEFPFEDLANNLKNMLEEGWRIFIVMPNDIEIKRIISILEPYSLPVIFKNDCITTSLQDEATYTKIIILNGMLKKGMKLKDDKLIIIGEWDIFGEKTRTKPIQKIKGIEISDFGMLKVGDLVVHQDYGIGKYMGLKLIERDNKKSEFLIIEYRDGDKLYVPVFRLNLLHKYRGIKDALPELHKLGTRRWENEKKKAKKSLRELTSNLLRLYARRKLLHGFSFPPPDELYREFESTFPYEETPDQERAINDVLKDMESTAPMDRLICGDVGFGKTEVALRASFKAIMAGKQVALLVPTTILALQHYQTFTERFKNYPVKIELLTRMRSPMEIRQALEDIRNGKTDLVIGTHRLLSGDVSFKDLGLLIIDEEHRFGVLQKEKLKKIKEGVDAISMTATPIPRSLQMSLSGIRDMSVIYTPPPARQAIRTIVSYFNDEIVRDAIVLEKMRGGQTFFIHNEIHNIESIADYIKRIVPEAKVAIAHGKLEKRQIEKVMIAFIKKEIDVLISTTIIASGIDIPTANTIIVENAHRFGLTDLYQLKGRVGRSKETAYAYFLIPEGEHISEDARKRLSAIQEHSELGSGFKLAMRDLEIRGAGELLGTKQSGHIFALGFELFSRLLEETVQELSGKPITEEIEPDINVGVESYIPEDYIPDIQTRLEIYKKISIARTEDDFNELVDELKDRFGRIPEPLDNLVQLTKLRNLLSENRIIALLCNNDECNLNIREMKKDDLSRLFRVMDSTGIKYRLDKHNLKIALPGNTHITQLTNLLKKIFIMVK